MWPFSVYGATSSSCPWYIETPCIYFKGEPFSVYDSRWYTPSSMRHTNHSLLDSSQIYFMKLRVKPLPADEFTTSMPMGRLFSVVYYTHLPILTLIFFFKSLWPSVCTSRWWEVDKSVPMGVSCTEIHYTHLPLLTLIILLKIKCLWFSVWYHALMKCWNTVPMDVFRTEKYYTHHPYPNSDSSNKSDTMIQRVILLAGESRESLCYMILI